MPQEYSIYCDGITSRVTLTNSHMDQVKLSLTLNKLAP